MPKRLLVTGSRTWDDTELVRRALAAYGQAGDTLVTGGCPRGADAIAEQIWRGRGRRRPVETWPAEWDKCGRSAGPRRNQAMVASLAPDRGDLVLAFIRDGSRGASQCARAAEAAGITVVRHER
jgi:hypothetical protein